MRRKCGKIRRKSTACSTVSHERYRTDSDESALNIRLQSYFRPCDRISSIAKTSYANAHRLRVRLEFGKCHTYEEHRRTFTTCKCHDLGRCIVIRSRASVCTPMTEQRGHGFDIRLEIETLLAGNEDLDVVGKGNSCLCSTPFLKRSQHHVLV
jgi:hypothetical protein